MVEHNQRQETLFSADHDEVQREPWHLKKTDRRQQEGLQEPKANEMCTSFISIFLFQTFTNVKFVGPSTFKTNAHKFGSH